MKVDAITSLKSNLADLTHILYLLGNELELAIENSTDEQVKNELRQTICTLRDSNSSVIQFYHEIDSNEEGMRKELFNDEAKMQSLQKEVDKLQESINMIVEANKNFVNIH